MKFSCLKNNLERYLNIAERFTGKNITLPILGNILLEAATDYFKITATNLEYAVEIMVPSKIIKEGKVSIPAKIINSLIQNTRDEKIDLEEKQGNLLIKTNTRNGRINGVSTEDFPLIPNIKKNNSIILNGSSLKEGLEKVLPSVSNSDFKPEFTGVFFKFSTNELSLVATDTFRLAEYKITLPKKNEQSFSFILPQKVVQELTRVVTDDDEQVKIYLGDNQFVMETGNIKITSRVIDSNFPEYNSIIPKEFETTVYLNRSDLKESIKASSVFASKLLDVNLQFNKDSLEISSANQDVGEYKNILSVKTSSGGKNTKISFNHKYLLDGVNSLDDDEIFIGCNAENTPSLFHNRTNHSFLYVLMPIRLS